MKPILLLVAATELYAALYGPPSPKPASLRQCAGGAVQRDKLERPSAIAEAPRLAIGALP